MILQYSTEIMKLFENPKHVGELDVNAPNVLVGIAGQQSGGDCIQLFLQVDKKQRIIQAKFKAYGGVATIATAEKLVNMLLSKTLTEIALINSKYIINALHLPKERYYCALLAEDALKAACDGGVFYETN